MQGIFRLQDNTPEAYTEDSRDFQLMLRLYDCVNNGVKFYIDSIPDTVNTKKCNAALLDLLKTKLGFFSSIEFQERELRYILRGFPYIIRDKGSLKAIKEAVYVYMNAMGLSCPHSIYVDKTNHLINIMLETDVSDTTVLEEILKYIIPAGYEVSYTFYVPDQRENEYSYSPRGITLGTPDSISSVLRGSTDSGNYGFIEASVYRTNGYEISAYIDLSDGVLSGVEFVASENAPHLYCEAGTSSKSWHAENTSTDENSPNYVWTEDDTYSPYGISIVGTPELCSVDGKTNSAMSLYYTDGENVSDSRTWTNYSNQVLGAVGSANVIGYSNETAYTLTADTF